MTYGELKRVLKKNGNRFHHQGKRHEIWENVETGEQYPVGRHDKKEVRDGTHGTIKRAAGLK
jgi:hypothetical protein